MKPKLILIAILFLTGALWAGNILADCIQDPVSYWPFDQDTPPYENILLPELEGTCEPGECPAADPDGQVGSALLFDGFDDGISIADTGDAAFDRGADDSFSIGVWFRRQAVSPWSGNEVLVGRYASNQIHFWVGLNNNTGVASFLLWDADSFNNYTLFVTGSTGLADGRWHHIVAVRDGQNDLNILYVDGVEVGSLPVDYNGPFTGDAPMYIGKMNTQYHFNGSIDDVTFFDVAVPGDIVAAMFAAGGAGSPICTDNLPPQITSTAPTSAVVGVEYVYNPVAEDPDGDPLSLSWSLPIAPEGMQIDEATGAITWTPADGTTTSGDVTLVVDDGLGGSDEELFNVIVDAEGTTPTTDPGTGSSGGGSDDGGGGGCFIKAITFGN